MEFINKLIGMSGTATVLCGAFVICLIGYAIGSIKIKGVSLGTAGLFIRWCFFGYKDRKENKVYSAAAVVCCTG